MEGREPVPFSEDDLPPDVGTSDTGTEDEVVDPTAFLKAAGVTVEAPPVKVKAENIHDLLDNPTVILEQLYDLGMHRLPACVSDLRQKREEAVVAKLSYEVAFRKAQLDIQEKATAKITIAERELKASKEVEVEKLNADIAQVKASSAQDVVFLIKDQINIYQNLLMWKESEVKATPSGNNAPRQTGGDVVRRDPTQRPW